MDTYVDRFKRYIRALREEQFERYQDLQALCMRFGQRYLNRTNHHPPHLDIEATAAEAIERLFLSEDFETATLAELASRLQSHLNTCFWRLAHPKHAIRSERPLDVEPISQEKPDDVIKTEELRKLAAKLQGLLLEGLSRIKHARYHDLIVQEHNLLDWGVQYRTANFAEPRSGRRNTALCYARDQFRSAVSEVVNEQLANGASDPCKYLQTALEILGAEADVVELLKRLS